MRSRTKILPSLVGTTSTASHASWKFRTLATAFGLVAVLLSLSASASEPGFKSIFNGKDLTGWTGDPTLWSAKDGVIIGQTTAQHPITHNTFLIWTNGTVGDFELRCKFRITSQNDKGFANSGIQYRSKVLDPKGWVVGGYQADMEAGPNYTGILYEEKMTRGIMATRGERVVWDSNCVKRVVGKTGAPEELQAAIKKNEWNDYVIRAHGNHLEHIINGKLMVDVIDDCASKRAANGVLALQLHQGGAMKVEFRDLELAVGSGDRRASAAELKKLQGTWQVTALEADGSSVPKELIEPVYITVKGEEFELFNTGAQIIGTVALDPSTRPPHIDIYCLSGPHKGETLPGIYEVNGDGLRLCYSQIGKSRPKVFATADGVGLVLVDYKKKKA